MFELIVPILITSITARSTFPTPSQSTVRETTNDELGNGGIEINAAFSDLEKSQKINYKIRFFTRNHHVKRSLLWHMSYGIDAMSKRKDIKSLDLGSVIGKRGIAEKYDLTRSGSKRPKHNENQNPNKNSMSKFAVNLDDIKIDPDFLHAGSQIFRGLGYNNIKTDRAMRNF